jgi:hypothetical protein
MGMWEGLAMESLEFYPGLLCPTLLHPAGGPPFKQPHSHSCFRGGQPPGVTESERKREGGERGGGEGGGREKGGGGG